MFTVHDGALLRDGVPFRAVGVTYHPREAGCRIWVDWTPAAIAEDLGSIAGHGLNTVRVFMFWRDVEPCEGRLEAEVLGRLRAFAEMADSHGLACVVSVCTIWMNGQLLDLGWRRGRSLWRDEAMLGHAEDYLRAVADALDGMDNLLALDLGDEIGHVDPAEAARLSREDVARWQGRLATVVRSQLPSVLITQANDVSGVLGTAAFGPDNGSGLDLLSVHGWPLWSPGTIESTSAYKATQLPGFLIRYARAYGPALLDELGSYGVGEEVAAGYLRAATASSLGAGTVGVLAWCWQDISSRAEPYSDRPGERRAGLVRLDGTAKPALRALTGCATLASRLAGFRQDRPPTGLYLPEHARTKLLVLLGRSGGNAGGVLCSSVATACPPALRGRHRSEQRGGACLVPMAHRGLVGAPVADRP